MQDLGYELKNLRIKNKYSQGQVAQKLNVSENVIGYWENNRWNPSTENLINLTILYKSSLAEILAIDEDVVDLGNLTEHQVTIIFMILSEFRYRKNKTKSLSKKQKEIIAELMDEFV